MGLIAASANAVALVDAAPRALRVAIPAAAAPMPAQATRTRVRRVIIFSILKLYLLFEFFAEIRRARGTVRVRPSTAGSRVHCSLFSTTCWDRLAKNQFATLVRRGCTGFRYAVSRTRVARARTDPTERCPVWCLPLPDQPYFRQPCEIFRKWLLSPTLVRVFSNLLGLFGSFRCLPKSRWFALSATRIRIRHPSAVCDGVAAGPSVADEKLTLISGNQEGKKVCGLVNGVATKAWVASFGVEADLILEHPAIELGSKSRRGVNSSRTFESLCSESGLPDDIT